DNGTGSDGKGTTTELGARVPGIVRGPGVQRGVVSRAVADLTDIMPTLADYAGAQLPKDRPFDGFSLKPVLAGQKEAHREWIYSHLDDGRILRDARWLLEIDRQGKGERFYDCGQNRDGSNYKLVTNSTEAEVQEARARFAKILTAMPEPKPHAGVKPAAGKPAAANNQRETRFAKRDKNGDAVIDRDEFMTTLAGSNQTAGEERFKKLDANADGKLTKAEFLSE
ncbi:MAG: hypothetical protein IT423_01615, partial [Pirellulaceae bacterium]|nr:hypothetical protein [Pirellulaceae bacterium]